MMKRGLAGGLMVLAMAAGVRAQTAAPAGRADVKVQTFYLTNITQLNEGNDIATAVRNLIAPDAKVYFVAHQNALLVSATPEQLVLAQRIVHDLDQQRKTYRLAYTITELDGEKRVGTQHFAMVVVSGERTTMKQGSKFPVATGEYNPGSGSQKQFTYLDVGLNFDATIEDSENGVRLKTKVERSSISEETSGVGTADPIVRQTVFEGTSVLTAKQPLILGSLDVPGTTRHLDVAVMMEVVR